MLLRFLAVLLFAAAGWAQGVARMEEAIQSYVPNHHQFMGAVLVAKGNEVLLNKGYGSANLEWEVPNSPLSKFRLGSITKAVHGGVDWFTAASIKVLGGALGASTQVRNTWQALTLRIGRRGADWLQRPPAPQDSLPEPNKRGPFPRNRVNRYSANVSPIVDAVDLRLQRAWNIQDRKHAIARPDESPPPAIRP